MKLRNTKLIGGAVVFIAMALVLVMKLPVLQKMFEQSLWPDMTFYLNLGLQPGVALPVLGSILTSAKGRGMGPAGYKSSAKQMT